MALRLRAVILPEGRRRDVYVTDGKITFEPVEGARTVLDGGYMVPGLVDSHAHLALFSPAPEGATPEEQARASAKAQLAAGVLVVREPGSPTRAGTGIGPRDGLPRTQTAGQFLAPPGRYAPGLARATMADDLADAAGDELRGSRGWVKVVGDFPGPDGRIQPHYEARVLADAATRVHEMGGRIAIHATLPDVIQAAIDAGFDSIEHGTFLHPDQIGEMVRRSVAWVPTLIIGEGILGMLAGMGSPADEVERTRGALNRLPSMVRKAAESGVTVLAGTDAGMVPHGLIGEEMRALLAAGLTPDRALGAASWDARRYLGYPCIEEGAPADIVAYRDDPRGDAAVLGRPLLRILDGREIS